LVPTDLAPFPLRSSKLAVNAKMMAKIKAKKSLIHAYTLNIFLHFE
jgi:hypothetical protein